MRGSEFEERILELKIFVARSVRTQELNFNANFFFSKPHCRCHRVTCRVGRQKVTTEPSPQGLQSLPYLCLPKDNLSANFPPVRGLMCGVWRNYDLAGVGGGGGPHQPYSWNCILKAAFLYWRSDTHILKHLYNSLVRHPFKFLMSQQLFCTDSTIQQYSLLNNFNVCIHTGLLKNGLTIISACSRRVHPPLWSLALIPF